MARIWGKIIGGSLGFILGGGPWGAALGVAAGHALDQKGFLNVPWPEFKRRPDSGFSENNARQEAFTMGVIVLGAKMAKVEGRVTRAKIDAFKKTFQIKPKDEARIGRLFDNARKSADGFEPYAFNLAQTFSTHPAVLEEVLSGLFVIADADGGITPAEAKFLKNVAFTFNFTPEDVRRIAARTGVRLPSEEETRAAEKESARNNAADPYAILGISDKATNDEIKNAYRQLIRKHHPDKLVAEGMPPEFIATANEKMKRINVAYDTVSKARGIK